MAAPLQTKDKVPDIALPDQDGSTFTLSDVAGPLVVFFYPKDDTSGCTAEALAFQSLADEFKALGVGLVGISPDSPASHAKFRNKHGLSIRLLADEEKTVLSAFGVWAEKSMYGRKYMGVERSTFLLGPDRTVARVWPKVKVPGHAAEVLAAARDLVQGG